MCIDKGSLNENWWCTFVNSNDHTRLFSPFLFYLASIVEVFTLSRERQNRFFEMVRYVKHRMFLLQELQAQVTLKEAKVRLLREEISALNRVAVRDQ